MLKKSVSSKPHLLRDAPLPDWRGNLFFLLCLLLAKEAENTTHQGLKNLLNLALKLRWWPRTGSTLAAPRARASPGACSQLPAAHPRQAQIWGLCFWSSQGLGTAKGRNLNCALLLQVYIIHCFRKRSEYWVLGGDLAQRFCRNVFFCCCFGFCLFLFLFSAAKRSSLMLSVLAMNPLAVHLWYGLKPPPKTTVFVFLSLSGAFWGGYMPTVQRLLECSMRVHWAAHLLRTACLWRGGIDCSFWWPCGGFHYICMSLCDLISSTSSGVVLLFKPFLCVCRAPRALLLLGGQKLSSLVWDLAAPTCVFWAFGVFPTAQFPVA